MNRKYTTTILLSVFSLILFSHAGPALTPSNFLYRVKISFNNYPAPEVLTNFPALIKFDPSTPNLYDFMASPAGGDLRFTDAGGTNEMNYEIEDWNPAGDSLVWVQVPVFSNSNCIFAYWGNPTDTTPPVYTIDGSTWESNYIAVWHLADIAAEDSTANNWDGTSNGNADAPGIAAGAQGFNDTQFIHAGPGINLSNKSFTVSAWVRRANIGQDDYVLAHGVPVASQGLHFGFRANNQFTFAFWANDLNSPAQADSNVWHRWTGVFDAANSNRVLYRDGTEVVSDVAAGFLMSDPGTVFRIGERFGNARHDGQIDEVRVRCDTRSADWILASWLNVASNDVFHTISATEQINPASPVIATLPPTNITTSTADMIGRLVSTGMSETVVYIYWGTNDGGTVSGLWDSVTRLGTNVAPVPTDWIFTATGLTPNINFYYRYQAANAAGRVWALQTESFFVPGPPIIDHEPGATAIGVGQATINGRFLTESRGDVTFYGGFADGGNNPLFWPTNINLGPVAASNFSFTVSGLVYGITFWYHSYATNMYGDNWAPAATNFKTLPPPGLAISNGIATGIDSTGAVLNGTFQGPASVFDVWVFWGPTNGGTNMLAWSNSFNFGWFTNVNATSLSHTVLNLRSNSANAFSYMMSNCAEVTWATPVTLFNTKGPPLAENASGATNIGIGRADLQAELVAGGIADLWVFWGDNDGGTDIGLWDNQVLLSNRLEGVSSARVSNLLFGVQYYYRTFATNSCGGDWASTSSVFKTMKPVGIGPPGLTYRYFDNQSGVALFDPTLTLRGLPEDDRGLHDRDINYNGNFPTFFTAMTLPNSFAIWWEGFFIPDSGAGTYTFGLDSDDYSVLLLDLNGDGNFTDGGGAYDPGERVVNRPCCGQTLSQVGLEDRPYRIGIGFEETGGGERMIARYGFGMQTVFNNLGLIGATSGVFHEVSNVVGVSNRVQSALTATSAVLNAEFMGTDSVFYISAYWGPTDGGSNESAWSNSAFVGGFTNVPFTGLSQLAAPLVSNTFYYYTFRATNCAIDLWATSFSFRTLAPPIVNNGVGVSGLGVGRAVLNGELIGGGQADVLFYWGDDDGGTVQTNWDNLIAVSSNFLEAPFSASVSGLLYGVPYYYRAYATNRFGEGWAGTTEVFKTTVPLLNGPRGLTARVYDQVFGNGNLVPISNLIGLPEDGRHVFQQPLAFNGFGQFSAAFPELTVDAQYSLLWEGGFLVEPETVGWHSFGTASDDGSVIYIDLNQDGDFDDAGEFVLDNGGNHGRIEVVARVQIPAPGCYPIVIGFYENGGGEQMEMQYRPGFFSVYADLNLVDLTPPSTDPFFLDCSIPAASIVNRSPAGVTETSGVINATFSGSGSVFCVNAYWGLNDGDTNALAWSNSMAVGCFTNVIQTNLSLLVGGLIGNTQYVYTFRATNCATDLWATPVESLTTAGPLSVGNGAGPTELFGSRARFNGAIIAGGAGRASFYWGTTDGGTSAVAWENVMDLEPQLEGLPFSHFETNLIYGLRYYYRTFATNSFGPAWATNSETFKTPNPTVAAFNTASGMVLWLDGADAGTLVQSNSPGLVDQWLDKSGNGNHMVQTNPAGRPVTGGPLLNGNNVVIFDGGDDFLEGPPVLAAGDDTYTYVAVWRPHQNRTQVIFEQSEAPLAIGTRGSLLQVGAAYGYNGQNNDRHTLAPAAANQWNVSFLQLNGLASANVRVWDDGVPYVGTVDIGLANLGTTGSRVGNKLAANNEWFDGEIAEIMVFDRVLTTNEIDDLGSYLEQKHGLATAHRDRPALVRYDLETRPVTGVTQNDATLNGWLNTPGATHELLVYYGPTDGGTNPAAWANVAPLGWFTNGPFSLSRAVSGLAPESTYYFAFRATNCVDEFWSDAGRFLTAFPLTGYTHQMKVQACGYSGAAPIYDYPLLVSLSTNIPGFDYGTFASANGGDLRFISEGGEPIPHEVEKWDTNGASYVWVQVPGVSGTGTCVQALWGNASITSSPAAATWDADYVGVWHLAEDGGSGLFPDSANNNDASDEVGSDTLTTPGVVGDAQDFNAANNELVVANESNFDLVDAITVSVWFRVQAFTANWQALVSKGEGPAWRIHRSNNTQSLAWNAGGGGDLTAPPNIDDGNWHHIMTTKSIANGKEVYIDGVRVGSSGDNTPIGLNDLPMRIGENATAGGRNWNGDIDEVRVSSVVRSADWARATWSNTVPGSAFVCYNPVMNLATGAVDLALSKTVNTNLLTFGTNLVYTLNVMNLSPTGANAVVVTDVLPLGVALISAVPPVTTMIGQSNIFNLGFLAGFANTSLVLSVSVTSAMIGPITNTAWVATSDTEVSLLNNTDTAVTVLPDSDGDGLANPGDPDDDNDGFDDCAEMIANTDPLDASSFLWLRIMRTGTTDVQTVNFLTSLGRTYKVQATADLFLGPWTDVQTGIPGTGGPISVIATNPALRIYYRLGVASP